MVLVVRKRWFLVPFVLAFLLSLAFSYATYEAPFDPRVNVRWSEQVTQSQREALETEYDLAEPEYTGERTWQYEILDTSTDNIRRLVQDPAAADTDMIDRTTFALADPPPVPLIVLFEPLVMSSIIGFFVASGVAPLRRPAERLWRAARLRLSSTRRRPRA